MAGEFLKSHGIDINAEMARIQNAGQQDVLPACTNIHNVSLPETQPGSLWHVRIGDQKIDSITPAEGELGSTQDSIDGQSALLAPSLCHPHIHLDKAFLLSHPKYAHLRIETGDFQEAMTLTGRAKSGFEHDDLLERGQRVIDESVAAGVTHMRAFVELDAGVKTKCLDAGKVLRSKAESRCHVQLCAFAQLPLFSHAQDDPDGSVIRDLMRQAAQDDNVEAIGSAPYVETDREKMKKNVKWTVDLSIEFNRHLDFHLDYNLDPGNEPLIWHVIELLKERRWKEKTKDRTIVFGHCTRLTLFDDNEWLQLARAVQDADLPISFVGLPTSDLFMMGTGQTPEVRGTLHVPKLVKQYGLNACLGINNIGNAFTPQGSCDPLSLASQAVGIYQAGTAEDTQLLYECVSTRAKAAIGAAGTSLHKTSLAIWEGDGADLLLFDAAEQNQFWRTRKTVNTTVYLDGNVTGGHFVEVLPDRPTRSLTRRLTPDHRRSPASTAPQPRLMADMTGKPGYNSGQLPPAMFCSGPSSAPPAANQRSRQGRRQPDLVTSARFSQHASNADIHPHLQQRGPTIHQYAPIQQHHPQHHQIQRAQPQRYRHCPQPTILHPEPQRAVTHHLPHFDDGERLPFNSTVSAQASTTAEWSSARPFTKQTGQSPRALASPAVPPQKVSTYSAPVPYGPAQGSASQYGPPETMPVSTPKASAAKPLPPPRPPITVPAPPGGIKNYAKATEFVKRFAAHFGVGGDECNALEDLVLRYNKKDLDCAEFYAGVYRVLYRYKAVHLLPGLSDFLSEPWQGKDLRRVERDVEQDVKEQAEFERQSHQATSSMDAEPSDQEMQDDEPFESEDNVQYEHVPAPLVKMAPKKKRPIKGFSTQDGQVNDTTIDPTVLKPAHRPQLPPQTNHAPVMQSDEDEPMPDRDAAPLHEAAIDGTPDHRPSPGLVKLRLRLGPKSAKKTPSGSARKAATRARPRRAASISATKKRKASEALDTQASTPNGSNSYGSTPASNVPHVGPLYPTRRSVLNRDSRPYIHFACGARFSHPSDVKAHARKGNKGSGCGELDKWNEHPSCQADYVHIHYARVKDGFVILDQESHDRLEAAIQSGLTYAAEHAIQEATTDDSKKGKTVNKKRTTTKNKNVTNTHRPPAESVEEPTKYEFEFDTEGDADAEGGDASGDDEDYSMMSAPQISVTAVSAPPVATPVPTSLASAVPSQAVNETDGGPVVGMGDAENVAQLPDSELEWDGTALRAAALGIRAKRPRF